MKKILITGGAGYVGTLLTPQLLDLGYEVIVYDTQYFGCFLNKHQNLTVLKKDIRDIDSFKKACEDVKVVLHLACISNDPSFELDENLSKSINYDCFEDLVITAKNAGVKRFVYCSSSSVYGVSDQPDVTEEHPLVPLTLYNKYKGLCEPILFKHKSDSFECVVLRPATVCGYSPRMRFDLSVNILTNHAVNNKKIKVFGGTQLRPNLHIQDMCDFYKLLIEAPKEKIQGEIFNAGYQNQSILNIAEIVKKVVLSEFPEIKTIDLQIESSNDLRSYHINSDKVKKVLGFQPKFTIEDAVKDICDAFKAGKFINSMDNSDYFNVVTLKDQRVA
jgi:nucleoside-diphosphate-sugar epimerase